jgi:hypothetical protein
MEIVGKLGLGGKQGKEERACGGLQKGQGFPDARADPTR